MRMRSTNQNIFRGNFFDQTSRAITKGGGPSKVVDTHDGNFRFSFLEDHCTDEQITFFFNRFFRLAHATRYWKQRVRRDKANSRPGLKNLRVNICLRKGYKKNDTQKNFTKIRTSFHGTPFSLMHEAEVSHSI